MFTHDWLSLKEYNTEESNGVRYYVIDEKTKYVSVTTMLSILNKDFIKAWEKRVGKQVAEETKLLATDRGSAVHLLCEQYLKNEPLDFSNVSIHNSLRFNSMKGIIDNHINNIRGLEIPLVSHTMKVAGKADCIAEWDNTLSIIDFKTSNKIKKESWILNYFLQATCYSIMLEEMTGLVAKNIVVLIVNDVNLDVQVFIKPRTKYFTKLAEVYKLYNQKEVDKLKSVMV